MGKEPYVYDKRALYAWKKSPISQLVSFEASSLRIPCPVIYHAEPRFTGVYHYALSHGAAVLDRPNVSGSIFADKLACAVHSSKTVVRRLKDSSKEVERQ